jgi:MSHA biogenesis protein MshO
VDGAQQAVTYACVGILGALDANLNGRARLMRYSNYGFYATQQTPAGIAANAAPVASHTEAVLADKVSACAIDYDVPNQRFGLVAVRLTLTSANESVYLYNEIHVNNEP